MDFSLSREQQMFAEGIRKFADEKIAPKWIQMDETGTVPNEIIKGMADLGLLGMVIGEEYGGQSATFADVVIANEEIAYSDPSLALSAIVGLYSSWSFLLQRYGSEDAKGEILTRTSKGEAMFGIASTESQGGTDIAGLHQVSALTQNGNKAWKISGEKSIVSGGQFIDRMSWGGGWFLIARSSPAVGANGLTTFAFLSKKDGKRVQGVDYHKFSQVGRNGLDTGSLRIDDVNVEDRYRIGEANNGFRIAMEGFNLGRIGVAGSLVGCSRWLLDQGLNWVSNRKIRDRPMASYQSIGFEIEELYENIEVTRLLAHKAAWLADRYYKQNDSTVRPLDIGIASALAKISATSLASKCVKEVMEWHGGVSYFTDMPLYRVWHGIQAYLAGAEGSPRALRDMVASNIINKKIKF
jgi:acyl-CoA dehydrogenase